MAYPITFIQYPPVINSLPTKFGNNILDTLVSNLIPNFNKLELLSCKV